MILQRALPIANLIGCCAISAVILVQWFKERGSDEKIRGLNERVAAETARYEAEKKRALLLESDVIQLKESIGSLAKTRNEIEEAMAKMIAEREAHAASINAAVSLANQANLEKVKTWQEAIAVRDTKIRELNASLSATRARLDEAVEKLKTAGAR